jgi:hypothetical protein
LKKDILLVGGSLYLASAMPNGEWIIKPNSAVATKQIMTFQILDGTTKQDQVEFTIVISREYLFPFGGSRSDIIVINTTNVSRSVYENEVLSPESIGSKNTNR